MDGRSSPKSQQGQSLQIINRRQRFFLRTAHTSSDPFFSSAQPDRWKIKSWLFHWSLIPSHTSTASPRPRWLWTQPLVLVAEFDQPASPSPPAPAGPHSHGCLIIAAGWGPTQRTSSTQGPGPPRAGLGPGGAMAGIPAETEGMVGINLQHGNQLTQVYSWDKSIQINHLQVIVQ